MSKDQSRLGTNPLGGALDWLEQAPAPPSKPVEKPPQVASAPASQMGEEGAADSTRRGVAPGYRRHTLLMRDDQIEQLDRLLAQERLNVGSRARNKKDVVEEAFDLFLKSPAGKPRS